MASETHVFTVGASLLSNLARDVPEVAGWARAPPDDPRQEECERSARPGSRLFDAAIEALRRDPRGYSAELNAFYGFMGLRGADPRRAEVVLLSTDTGVGWFCTSAIGRHLEEKGIRVHHGSLGPLSLRDLEERGLVRVEGGRIALRAWVRELLKAMGVRAKA